MTGKNKTGPWTRILKAAHNVLSLWDNAIPFDTDDPEVIAALDELAAASANVDLRLAASADAAHVIFLRLGEGTGR